MPVGVPVPEHEVSTEPVSMPDHIDADLRDSGKSDFVIAGIQRRRDAQRAAHAVRGYYSLCGLCWALGGRLGVKVVVAHQRVRA